MGTGYMTAPDCEPEIANPATVGRGERRQGAPPPLRER
jgi:hypothetical protein